MSFPFFDVGVTAERVAAKLVEFPVISVVGFKDSGKSTLAEKLYEDLPDFGYAVRMQDATNWLPRRPLSGLTNDAPPASVDPEILAAIEKFQGESGRGCWIVDNAEVLLAYATEEFLGSLGALLRRRRFSMVLIRNRFVLEDEGWFHERLAILSAVVPAVFMQPLSESEAVRMATAMFDGPFRIQDGEWLASMSGGIPGLMIHLYPWASLSSPDEPFAGLVALTLQAREKLQLDRPVRQMVLGALARQVLPPAPFLSQAAAIDLGALELVGMVSPDYSVGRIAFRGGFWRLVAGQAERPEAIPARLTEIGLNLEDMVRSAESIDAFSEECRIASGDVGAFALAFAASMYCSEQLPTLVRPLRVLFSEIIGRSGLAKILRSQGISPAPAAPIERLADQVFELAEA